MPWVCSARSSVSRVNGVVAGTHKLNDAIDQIISPLQGVVTPETTLAKLREVFAQDNVAVVREGQKVTAVVTKIDLIEHLAAQAA